MSSNQRETEPGIGSGNRRITRYSQDIEENRDISGHISRSQLGSQAQGQTESERFQNIEDQARNMAENSILNQAENSAHSEDDAESVRDEDVVFNQSENNQQPDTGTGAGAHPLRARRVNVVASTPAPGQSLWGIVHQSNLNAGQQSSDEAHQAINNDVHFWTMLDSSFRAEESSTDTLPDDEPQPEGTDKEKAIARRVISHLLTLARDSSNDGEEPLFILDLSNRVRFERAFDEGNMGRLQHLIQLRMHEEDENPEDSQWAHVFLNAARTLSGTENLSVPFGPTGVNILLGLMQSLVNRNCDSVEMQRSLVTYDREYVTMMESFNKQFVESIEASFRGFIVPTSEENISLDCFVNNPTDPSLSFYRGTHMFYYLLLGQKVIIEKNLDDIRRIDSIKQKYDLLLRDRNTITGDANDVLARGAVTEVNPLLVKLDDWTDRMGALYGEIMRLYNTSNNAGIEPMAALLNISVAEIGGWYQLVELLHDYRDEIIVMPNAINHATDRSMSVFSQSVIHAQGSLRLLQSELPPGFQREERGNGVRRRNRQFASPPSVDRAPPQNNGPPGPPQAQPRPGSFRPNGNPPGPAVSNTPPRPPPGHGQNNTPRLPPPPPGHRPQPSLNRGVSSSTINQSRHAFPSLTPSPVRNQPEDARNRRLSYRDSISRDHSEERRSERYSEPRRPRVTEEEKVEALCKQIERALQKGLEAEHDSAMEPKPLAAQIQRLNGYEKDLNKYVHNRVEIPHILYDGVPMDAETALFNGLDRMNDHLAKLEDIKSLRKKQEAKQMDLYSKEYEAVTIHPFKISSDYLAFRESVSTILANVRTANNSLPFISTVYKSLGPEVSAGIPKGLKTISELLRHLYNAHNHGIVNTIIIQVVNKLPSARNASESTILSNVAKVMEHCRLIKLFQLEDTIGEAHTRSLESVTLKGERYNEYVRILQILRKISPDERERWFTRASHDLSFQNEAIAEEPGRENENEIVDPTALDRALVKTTLPDMDRYRAWYKMTQFVAQTLRDAQNESNREFLMIGNDQSKESSKKKEVIMQVVQEESINYNQSQNRGRNFPRKNNNKSAGPVSTGAKPASKPATDAPMVACPVKSLSCSDVHQCGSAFFCEKFKALSITQRRAAVDANNLCKKCLRSAHSEGTACTKDDIYCRICGSSGDHNRLICPNITGEQVEINTEEADETMQNADYWTWDDDDENPTFNLVADDSAITDMCLMMTCEDTESSNEWTSLDLSESLIRPSPFQSETDPDIPDDKVQSHIEAIQKVLCAINESKITGMSRAQLKEQEKKNENIVAQHTIMMMQESDKDEKTEIDFEIPEIRSAVNSIKEAIEKSGGKISVEDVADQLYPGLPGICHSTRPDSEVDHLRVGPATEGLQDLFQSIYDVSVKCHKAYPNSFMQVCQAAVLVTSNQARAHLEGEFPNMKFIEKDGETYALVDTMLDTGASLLLADKRLMNALQPAPVKEWKTAIRTGSSTHLVDDFTHSLTFLCGNGENTRKTRLAVNPMLYPVGRQAGMSSLVKKIIIEEFKIPQNRVKDFVMDSGWKSPLLLLGLTRRETIAHPVNPLSLGGRPGLFNPNIQIMTSDIMYSDNGRTRYFISGKLGSDPVSYSIKENSPTFLLQPQNIQSGKLMNHQQFSPDVFAALEEVEQLNDNGVFVVSEEVGQALRDVGAEDMGERYAHLIPETILHIQEMCDKPAVLTDECSLAMGELVKSPEEQALLTLQGAKELERFITSETGYLDITPLCPQHKTHVSDIVRTCPSCKTANDPQSHRHSVLLSQIDANLHEIEDPRNPGKFTLVQVCQFSERRELLGHLRNNNLHSAIKASKRIVEKLRGTNALKILDDGNRAYLQADKYRIYSPEELEDVAQGLAIQQSFCRNWVSKPDSETSKSIDKVESVLSSILSAPVRLVTDTSRPIWSGGSLSSLNPAAKGFTPSLFQIISRFTFYEKFAALDVSKAVSNPDYLLSHNLTLQYHSIRLSNLDMNLFSGAWFSNPEKHGTSKPYLVSKSNHSLCTCTNTNTSECCVCDFGMGSSHNSLYCGCLRAVKFFNIEETKVMVPRNLFVDNVGLAAKTRAELENLIQDCIQGFGKLGLNIAKVFLPASLTDRVLPDQTITLGLIWFLKGDNEDTVVPRVKLNLFGAHRGQPLGEDLDKTDVYKATFTRRVFSRLLSSLYDLQYDQLTSVRSVPSYTSFRGRHFGPIIAQGKLLLHTIVKKCERSSNLDLNLAENYPEFDIMAKSFWSELKFLQTEILPLPRSFITKGSDLSYIVIPHDASPVSIASVIYAISKDRTSGGRTSNIACAKQSLSSSSVPRNEKSSSLQAVNLLYQLISALQCELEEHKEYEAIILGDSTISSYMFDPAYDGDGTSKCIFSKIESTLSCLGNLMKNLTVKFAWIDNSKLKSADYLTKPQSKPLQFSNGKEWRHGDEIYLNRGSIKQFTYFSFKDGHSEYTKLPDYLRKVSHEDALGIIETDEMEQNGTVTQAMITAIDDVSYLDLSAPPPWVQDEQQAIWNSFENKFEDDMLLLFYPQLAAKLFLKQVDYNSKDARVPISRFYIVTRSGLNTTKIEDMKTDDFSPLLTSGASILQPINKLRVFSHHKVAGGAPVPGGQSTEFKRSKSGPTREWNNLRLPGNCYDAKTILSNFDKDVPLYPIFPSKDEYLRELGRFEKLHSILNAHVIVAKAVKTFKDFKIHPSKRKPINYMRLYCAAWSQLLRSDQHYYPLRSKENFHDGFQIYFNKYRQEDPVCDKFLGTLNVPRLAENSPLLRKLLLSVHKEMTDLCEIKQIVHNNNKRTLARAQNGFFGLSAPHLAQVLKKLLENCTGCLRSSSKFYATMMGPPVKTITRDTGKLFDTVSMDALGQLSCQPFAGARTMCKLTFFTFVCCTTNCLIIIGSDGTGKSSVRRAIISFRLLTGSSPTTIFCDAATAHSALAGTEGFENMKVFGSHSQHKQMAETMTKQVKSLLRKITNTSPAEPLRSLGSCTIWDMLLLFRYISFVINMTPIKTEISYLCPGHLLYPSRLLNSIAEEFDSPHWETLGLGKYREGNEILMRYHDIIRREQLKIIASLQSQYEKDKYYARKKHEKTDISAQVGDVVLVDYHQGENLRMGKIISLSPHQTDAVVLVAGKQKTVPVKDLRILSVYRS